MQPGITNIKFGLASRKFTISPSPWIQVAMNDIKENVDSWFRSLGEEALNRNYKSECTWTNYKDDLEGTRKILSWLPNKLKHDVMVPIGPKAFMRGKIVHTNELLVSLGETWFVNKSASQTVEVCDRRIAECDRMIERLRKERELLESKQSLPAEKEAFGSEERPEIIEYVSEEEHHEWKKQHRIKEREYRKKLAEIRNQEKKPIETEEDLWNRLDELELREELEDELHRLSERISEEEEEEEGEGEEVEEEENMNTEKNNEESDKCITSDQYNNNIKSSDSCINSVSVNNDGTNVKNSIKNRKLSTSFALDKDDSLELEPLILEINHSSVEQKVTPSDGVINSPGDIYNEYLRTLTPKSILKCTVNVNREKELEAIKSESEKEVEFNISSGVELPDVFARNLSGSEDKIEILDRSSSYKEPARRISKFKASRMKKS